MSSLQKSVLKSRLPPMGPPPARPSGGSSLKRNRSQKDYTPTMWDEYYGEKQDVKLDNNSSFRVYLSSRSSSENASSGPLVVLLHGGGYSALTWSHFSKEITAMVHCQCLAIDLRGHGDSRTENETDLSADTLASDVAQILATLYPENAPSIMLVGHSMGGAICVQISHLELIPTLMGCVVIDVVEGTAMEALASMQSFLRSRPTFFKSISHAIEWSIRSGQIRNVDSAKVSMPGQIINVNTRKLATNELPLGSSSDTPILSSAPAYKNPNRISEDGDDEEEGEKEEPTKDRTKNYTWRIDLAKSEVFWSGWFSGLSQKFLDLRVPKLLILASIDGLDRTLTVGQMQGRFQMQVLARCGHAVHEDRPHEVANVIASYMVRNKFAEAAVDFVGQLPSC